MAHDKLPGVSPVRRTSLVTLILERLKEYIADAGLRQGDRLPPERVLATQLGVSRPSLRAALDLLSERGALRRVQGGGTYLESNIAAVLAQVGEHDDAPRAQLREVVEARFHLEPVVAELAADRANDEQLADLEQSIEQIAGNLDDLAAWFQHELHFHVRLARMCGNSVLTTAVESLYPQILGCWQSHADTLDPAVSLEEHRAILDALKRRDGEGANKAMAQHLQHFRVLCGM